MHTTTDSIVLVILVFFLYRGWSRGLLRILIGPISLALAAAGGYIYYTQTHNWIASLLTVTIGSLLLSLIFSLLINVQRTVAKGNETTTDLNRVIGSIISLLWGGAYVMLVLLLITIVPTNVDWFKDVRSNVLASRSYALTNKWVGHMLPLRALDVQKITRILQDPAKLEKIKSSDEYKNLMDNKAIQELFSDAKIQQQIRDKDTVGLMSNPKMQSLFQDKQLLQELLNLNVKIIEESVEPKDTGPEKPRWMDIQ